MMLAHAEDCIARCRALALHTEMPGCTTRTFLSSPMHAVHRDLARWMEATGMSVRVDGVGNLRGRYPGVSAEAPVLYIGSHLDTVPNAGAFDGILGVVIGVKLMELLARERRPFAIEVIGFSEEEGVRFGYPFIGSKAFIGERPREDPVRDAIRAFGLDPDQSCVPEGEAVGYLEFHIEQGPVLESVNKSLGIVEAIAGQTRMLITFEGRAGHAGTTPMNLREDALCAAAEWVGQVEFTGRNTRGLVATVGWIEAHPGAPNVIPGTVSLTLDVRHRNDEVRHAAVQDLLAAAERRGMHVTSELKLDQPSVAMDGRLTGDLARAAPTAHRMHSGAGHDAMIVAQRMPAAMLFLRSPGGLSHHPDETVLPEDVSAALTVGWEFLNA